MNIYMKRIFFFLSYLEQVIRKQRRCFCYNSYEEISIQVTVTAFLKLFLCQYTLPMELSDTALDFLMSPPTVHL